MTKLQRLLEHLKQPSTIAGIVVLSSLFGIAVTTEKVEGILAVLIIAVELWQVIRNERKK